MGQALRDPGAEKSVTRARGRGRTGWARSIVTYATHLLEILHELEHSLIGLLRARRGPGGGGEISRGPLGLAIILCTRVYCHCY